MQLVTTFPTVVAYHPHNNPSQYSTLYSQQFYCFLQVSPALRVQQPRTTLLPYSTLPLPNHLLLENPQMVPKDVPSNRRQCEGVWGWSCVCVCVCVYIRVRPCMCVGVHVCAWRIEVKLPKPVAISAGTCQWTSFPPVQTRQKQTLSSRAQCLLPPSFPLPLVWSQCP